LWEHHLELGYIQGSFDSAMDAINGAHENLIILMGIAPKNLNVKEKSEIVNNNSQ
jgi:hypothetical protein